MGYNYGGIRIAAAGIDILSVVQAQKEKRRLRIELREVTVLLKTTELKLHR